MSLNFRAFQVVETDQQLGVGKLTRLGLDDPRPGNVIIRAHYSSVNYKDALGATGKGKIMKTLPVVGGIDVSGEVESSADPRFKPGDPVLVTGCGLGEAHDGGYAEYARVPSEWVVPVPLGLTTRGAMILGTAGFTAALALHRMLANDQTADKGPILVTGASGGVGSFAVALFAKLGFRVIAASGKESEQSRLRELGAAEVKSFDDLSLDTKPLSKARFGGAVDNLGGEPLAKLIPAINLWGNVAVIGLAVSADLHTTVFPEILRGVSLLGISSANCPMPLRLILWQRLANEWQLDLDRFVSEEVPLSAITPVFDRMLERKTAGRILINCRL